MTLLITGCATTPSTPLKKSTQKPEFNAALQDKTFQETFKTRTINLVAPASGTHPEKLESLQSITELNIDIPPNLMSEDIIFHSNNDKVRFELLKKALFDKSKNTIIWGLRGGYGSARLLDKLRFLPKPKQEKIFIGYSDQTALHLFLAQQWGWKTIHGAGLLQLLSTDIDPENFKKIAEIVDKKNPTFQISNLKPLNTEAKKTKKITGRLTGGNLTVIQSGIKTHWQIKPTGKILFLEDTGEKGYRIDRTLYQLREAGILKGVKAIVFGDFTDAPAEDILIALERFAKEIQVPVYKTDQFGHGNTNYPLVYNAKSEILPPPESEDFTLVMHLE